jgi:hypothetical protein
MAAGALVITTDAPPMNELINHDRGYLAHYKTSGPKGLGTRYWVSEEALDACILEAFNASASEKERKVANAKNWTITNEADFKTKLEKHLKKAEIVVTSQTSHRSV